MLERESGSLRSLTVAALIRLAITWRPGRSCLFGLGAWLLVGAMLFRPCRLGLLSFGLWRLVVGRILRPRLRRLVRWSGRRLVSEPSRRLRRNGAFCPPWLRCRGVGLSMAVGGPRMVRSWSLAALTMIRSNSLATADALPWKQSRQTCWQADAGGSIGGSGSNKLN